ncbi:MAG: (Na+)-NQR maturation NqrM [Aureliella sp.]
MLTLLSVFGVTLLAFMLVIAGMAVGVMMGRREISGSCGGLGSQSAEGGESSCSLCSNPAAACRELKDRMEAGSSSNLEPAASSRSRFDECEKDCVEEGCSKEAIDACRGV